MSTTFKGYHSKYIPFDAMQEVRQLRFNALINKRKLQEAYRDLSPNASIKCPYCDELFTGYWAKHNCQVHVRFDHEKENEYHMMAMLSTLLSLSNKALEATLESSPEYSYYTSLAGSEKLQRPTWFNRLFLKHYDVLAFIKAHEGITLTELYDQIPDQKERDVILLKIFNLQMRHLVHSQETERKSPRPLLSEVDATPNIKESK